MTAASTLAAIRTARRLAAAHPTAALPCPLCAVSVGAANLEAHLRKVHGDLGALAGEAARAAPLVLAGRDRAVQRELLGALSIVAVAGAIGFPLAIRFELGDAALYVLLAVLLPIVGGLMAAMLDAFGGTLELEGGQLRLRRVFGLRVRVLSLPARVELGRMRALRSPAGMAQYESARHVEVDDGVYLRLTDGRTSITVTTPGETGFAKHWADEGWHEAPRTRRADLVIGRDAWVALEYALSEAGSLTLRVP